MTREPAEPRLLDYLIRAGAIHSMTGETYRSVGLRGADIVAVSTDMHELDDLAGADTAVVDAGDLTLLPAFADSHEHLMEASRNTLLVPVNQSGLMPFTGERGPIPPGCAARGGSARLRSWSLSLCLHRGHPLAGARRLEDLATRARILVPSTP
jgi:hypothetical protein